MAMVLISHDLGVVAENTDRVCVMYAGRIVEDAPIDTVFEAPAHPYTRGLLAALPELEGPRRVLVPIAGVVPEPANLPPGCSFAPRCDRRDRGLRDRAAGRATELSRRNIAWPASAHDRSARSLRSGARLRCPPRPLAVRQARDPACRRRRVVRAAGRPHARAWSANRAAARRRPRSWCSGWCRSAPARCGSAARRCRPPTRRAGGRCGGACRWSTRTRWARSTGASASAGRSWSRW